VVRPLVVASHELRWLGRGWLAAATVTLAAVLGSRSLGDLAGLEVGACGLVFGLAVGGSVGGLVLGVRTGPPILYRRIFDLAPPPPASARSERPEITARRAVATALVGALGLAAAAVFVLPVTLVLLGRPKHDVLDHLPQAAGLVAGCWMVVAGAVALRVAEWIRRWQSFSEKLVLCAPLHSGLLRHVYYAAEPAAPAGGG
jgi:hypothetical protein